MLRDTAYDVLEFSLPAQGMNQNIAPDHLPPSFAYVLENILARPLGEGQVRFGTREVFALPQADSTILKLFPFVNADGSEQILLYVQEYAHDGTATDFVIIDGRLLRHAQDRLLRRAQGRQFSFTSPHHAPRYAKDTAIKVEYTLNGHATLHDAIATLTVAGTTVTVTLTHNALPPEAHITRVSFATGTLYSYALSSQTLSRPLRQNLCVACVPRSATFMGKLLICNGVDRVMAWNGETLDDVCDFVKEETANLYRTDDRHVSFTVSPSFDPDNYKVGNLLHLKVNGVTTQVTITACAVNGQTVTVATSEDLPVFIHGQTNIFYQAWPPRFSFLFVAHDRLWALGEGAAGLGYRHPAEALRVYYTFRPNSVTGWFHERTKTEPSLDLSKKHGEPDNLEAICLLGTFIAFMGRKKTQVYQGQNPLSFEEGGDFAFTSILPVGIVHGDLLVELPNDVYFITAGGLQSFSTLNAAQQFAASSFDAVDPKIQQDVSCLMASDRNYRAAGSFRYDGGSVAGFKIGQTKVLCSLFSTTLYSWSLFSGDFEKASSFLTLGRRLYLSLGNKVYAYADGNDGLPPLYADQGGKGLVPFSWTLPVVSLKGRRFANKRYEIHLDYPSSFTVRRDNQLSLGISGDLPRSYQLTSPCRFGMRGDVFQTVPLTESDNPRETDLGFRFDQPFQTSLFCFFKDRLTFMASRFWLTVSGYTKDGPITLKKIKLYGIIER